MNVRRATESDRDLIRTLWQEFGAEIPPPPGDDETFEEDWVDTSRDIREGAVYLAEDDQGPLGYVRVSRPVRGVSTVNMAHVSQRGRRQGVTKALLRAAVPDVAAMGATHVDLEVLESNALARTVWTHLGFQEHKRILIQPLDRLEARLAGGEDRRGDRVTVHVQSDDEASVARALAQFVPRLESPDVRSGDSWIRIADGTLDRDRDAQARLAKELSERLGAVTVCLAAEEETVVRFRLYERGLMVDEYLSVPDYYGRLSKGDELAMEANPTLVSRLTGADREQVRRIARTAESPADLPPANDLYTQIAQLMGLEP